MKIEFVMLIDQQGHVHMTKSMAQRLTFEIEPEEKIIVN